MSVLTNANGWRPDRVPEVPMLIGERVLLCAFSPVRPLLRKAGLRKMDPSVFQEICAEVCLEAPVAKVDAVVGATSRDLRGIAAGAATRLKEMEFGEFAVDWLHAHDGGMGGGDPRGFWCDAIRWEGRTQAQVGTPDIHKLVWEFCHPIYQAMTDPKWLGDVDTALAAPYDDRDAAICARQAYSLLDGAAAGGEVNRIGTTIGPMRDWQTIRAGWTSASAEVRSAMKFLAGAYWEDRKALGWAKGSRINDAWLDDRSNQIDRVLGDA